MKEQALVQGHKSIYVRPVIELFSMQVTYCLMAIKEKEEEMKQEDARSKEFGGFFDSEYTEGTYGESIWEE